MKIYYTTLEEAAKIGDEYCVKIFPRRFTQAARFVQKEDRLRSIGAGLLLHGILGIAEQEIQFTSHGKPYLPDFDVYFNLSHSGNYVVLATHNKPLGIDMEEINEANLEIAPGVYTAEELEWMNEAPPLRFTILWTMKESVLKAIGSGLSVAPLSFSVLPMIKNGTAHLFGRTRYSKTIRLKNYLLSVTTEDEIKEVECTLCKGDDFILSAPQE